ncbi:hypothetical protein PFISCL1PPCAC_6212 [Pristionchus fissidentatus]|uniref:Diphosphomevalonate decarboxylase n=1 Tax=Pristionchus fissidentatus TaxID=1538716 RepID=A0AAV5V5P3_9BILA|nr:hypothetical protein PFISCL1PPCAC_6212 [Pristionchus fissidentatus]
MIENKRQKMDENEIRITVEAHPNIALIKYWGKKSETEMTPLNDSISLAIDIFHAKTTLTARRVEEGEESVDTVSINGREITLNTRFNRVFKSVRDRLDSSWSFSISSSTNFPVAAGLASSAAGFAAIAFALGKAFDLSQTDIERLARYGSGSASRSGLPGLVQWKKGDEKEESSVLSHFPSSHWPDLRLVILVVKDEEKSISSKEGMERTARTSELLQDRIRRNPARIQGIIDSFASRDFSTLAELTMRDSNEFHAVCLDSYPPIQYLNTTSWSIINLVHSFNKESVRAAYTFDAGPNACIFTLKEYMDEFVSLVHSSFSIGDSIEKELRSVHISTLGDGPKVVE